MRKNWLRGVAVAAVVVGGSAGGIAAQETDPGLAGARTNELSPYASNFGHMSNVVKPGEQHSSNMTLVTHIPLGGYLHVSDIEIEQDLNRPYIYICKRFNPSGLDIVSIADPKKAKIVYSWRIDNPALHLGSGALDNKYFKYKGRYYDVQSFQFSQGGPDVDLGAVIFDVTGLPNPALVKEVARIHAADAPGGFHNIYMYKHSDGRDLLFATTSQPFTYIYDMGKVLAGAKGDEALIGKVPTPVQQASRNGRMAGYHDFYVAYDPASHQDKFYGGGAGGYHVYDVTKPEAPQHLFSITGVSGVTYGHTFTPTPDGAFAVGETEYEYAPLRMYDLRDAQAGKVKNINKSIGAWTANWQDLSHNHEVRWPYVFVSAYEDGLQIFNMMDPTNPTTVAYWRTYEGPHIARGTSNPNMGAWGIDIRNADGLIVISDMDTGIWAFHMEGFDGWNGHDWGMPNISTVQDWDHGPEGAPASTKPVT